jgi:hypothetical protein
MLALLLPVLLALPPVFEAAPDAKARFDAEIEGICAKYAGQPMFDKDGHTVELTCDWIRKKGADPSAGGSLQVFRRAFRGAPRLEDLRAEHVPSDLDCGRFAPVPAESGAEIRCRNDIDGLVSTVVYAADREGRLARIVVTSPFRALSLHGNERAVARGRISRAYEPWADASAETLVARTRLDAAPGDSVAYDGATLVVTLRAPVAPAE